MDDDLEKLFCDMLFDSEEEEDSDDIDQMLKLW